MGYVPSLTKEQRTPRQANSETALLQNTDEGKALEGGL